MRFVYQCSVDSKATLVKIMAWHWMDVKPLPEPMMTQFTDICIIRAQWATFNDIAYKFVERDRIWIRRWTCNGLISCNVQWGSAVNIWEKIVHVIPGLSCNNRAISLPCSYFRWSLRLTIRWEFNDNPCNWLIRTHSLSSAKQGLSLWEI